MIYRRAILTAEVLVGFAIVILCSSVLSTEKTVCRSHVTSDTKDERTPYFLETFASTAALGKRWHYSRARKEGVPHGISRYDGVWSIEEPENNPLPGDLGLVMKSQARHYALSAMLERPFKFSGSPLIVQYEVKFQREMACGGAYLKLLSAENENTLDIFSEKTPYVIMFGPDKCGKENKLHFIFRHKNPLKRAYQEKHARQPDKNIEAIFTDRQTHLLSLVLNPDNTFEIGIDQQPVLSGSLMKDFSPPVIPPKEILDRTDKKPANWDDRKKIRDSTAVKPDDWDETEPEKIEDMSTVKPSDWLEDEPELIPDVHAVKPEDWDNEIDGEWEPPLIDNPLCRNVGCGQWRRPLISNPKYKGKWVAPEIDNPNYMGPWSPRMIPNPDYFEDHEPYRNMAPINAIGLELWSVTDGVVFDNFIITDNKTLADLVAANSWQFKRDVEDKPKDGLMNALLVATNEKPWLWAVIIFVVILPVALIVTYWCISDETAERKKTDAAAVDVDQEIDVSENNNTETTGEIESSESIGSVFGTESNESQPDEDAMNPGAEVVSDSGVYVGTSDENLSVKYSPVGGIDIDLAAADVEKTSFEVSSTDKSKQDQEAESSTTAGNEEVYV